MQKMIDLKKLSIYYKYNGNPTNPKLYNERTEKWLNKEISSDEFMTIDKIDQNFVCIKSGGFSEKMVEEMELELSQLKKLVSDEAYEYLRLGKKPKNLEKPKSSWINRLVDKIVNK